MDHLLNHYGNHHAHCRKYIDLEHVLTLYVMDMVVNVLGRDHVDPFLLRERLFEPLIPLLDKYPKVKDEVIRWLDDRTFRSDECLHNLRDLAEEEVFGPDGDPESY